MELTKKNCMIAKNRMRGLAYTSCNCREENLMLLFETIKELQEYLEEVYA